MNWALYVIAAVITVHLLLPVAGVIIVQSGGRLPARSTSPSVRAAALMITIGIEAAIVSVIVLAAVQAS